VVRVKTNHHIYCFTSCSLDYGQSHRREAESEFGVSVREFQFSNLKFADDVDTVEEDAAKLGIT